MLWPYRSAYRRHRVLQLWPHRLTLPNNPPIYHWLWWVWGTREPKERPMEITDELRRLINQHSLERVSNTPDWILSGYLLACLAALDVAVQQRETWYGRDGRPSEPDQRPFGSRQ